MKSKLNDLHRDLDFGDLEVLSKYLSCVHKFYKRGEVAAVSCGDSWFNLVTICSGAALRVVWGPGALSGGWCFTGMNNSSHEIVLFLVSVPICQITPVGWSDPNRIRGQPHMSGVPMAQIVRPLRARSKLKLNHTEAEAKKDEALPFRAVNGSMLSPVASS